jgi:hypothetical protein
MSHCHAVTLSRCHTVTLSKTFPKNAKITYMTSDCHTVTPKRPKRIKSSKLHVISASHCHAVTVTSKNTKNIKMAKIAYLTSNKCHTVTLSRCQTVTPKRSKILIMSKSLNSSIDKYLCNCETVTLCDTALCDIFDGHLKDGRRHGMDTYLFSSSQLP